MIRQRVDSTGVSEAEITSQGKNIVVGLPGTPSDETLDLVRKSAQMRFRPVLAVAAPRRSWPRPRQRRPPSPRRRSSLQPERPRPDHPGDPGRVRRARLHRPEEPHRGTGDVADAPW
ncbi:hypothetical protein NKG05_27460 [Oerskovia sp. M15]